MAAFIKEMPFKVLYKTITKNPPDYGTESKVKYSLYGCCCPCGSFICGDFGPLTLSESFNSNKKVLLNKERATLFASYLFRDVHRLLLSCGCVFSPHRKCLIKHSTKLPLVFVFTVPLQNFSDT